MNECQPLSCLRLFMLRAKSISWLRTRAQHLNVLKGCPTFPTKISKWKYAYHLLFFLPSWNNDQIDLVFFEIWGFWVNLLKWPNRTKLTIKHLYLPYTQIDRPLTETHSLLFKQRSPARTKQKVRLQSVQIYKLDIILLGCVIMICLFTYIWFIDSLISLISLLI